MKMVCKCLFVANSNIVVPHCKIHNDASCDISQDGTFLATFVPSHRGFPDDTILAVFSLRPGSRGDCLFTKSFGTIFPARFPILPAVWFFFKIGAHFSVVFCYVSELYLVYFFGR